MEAVVYICFKSNGMYHGMTNERSKMRGDEENEYSLKCILDGTRYPSGELGMKDSGKGGTSRRPIFGTHCVWLTQLEKGPIDMEKCTLTDGTVDGK